MKAFFCKLIAPRPSFAYDMTEVEAQVMQEHAAYWKGLMDKGGVAVFGLVADPQGPFGIGVVEVESDAEANALTANDPTIKAKLGFRYEIHPMPRAVWRK